MPVGDLNEQFAGPPQALHRALGLMPALVIDQHFAQRKRHARLLQLVSLDPRRLGVGIDEDTALLIRPGVGIRVVGSGAVTLIDGARASDRREPAAGATDATDATIVALEQLAFYLLPAGTSLQFEHPAAPPHLQRLLHALASTQALGD